MARQTRQFIDLDAAFTVNPRTRDVATKTDENSIRNALRNIIHTRHYERPFHPEIGCQLHNLMFENMDPFTIIVAQQTIKDAITSHEPRVNVLDVTVTANDNNELFIQVVFQIKNTQTPSVFTTTFSRVR